MGRTLLHDIDCYSIYCLNSYNVQNVQISCSIISFDESVYKPFLVMTGHINVMLVLQICTDSLQVMAGSSTEIFPSSSDGTYDIGHIKVEEDLDIKGEEEVNVKREEGIGSEEEECIDIKDEDCIWSEEEKEEKEGIGIQEEEDVEIREEVSYEDIYNIT